MRERQLSTIGRSGRMWVGSAYHGDGRKPTLVYGTRRFVEAKLAALAALTVSPDALAGWLGAGDFHRLPVVLNNHKPA